MTGPALVVLGYLCGSFPSAVILTRRATGRDIRTQGSGNPGAVNVARSAGFATGVTVAVLDILKGAAPVALGLALGVAPIWLALTAVAAVLGHDFSFVLRGKGGKGVATTLGVALALAPLAALGAGLVWVAVTLVTRYSSLASLLALAALPPLIWLANGPRAYVWATLALALLAIAKHRDNIVRLHRGTERKFTLARSPSGG